MSRVAVAGLGCRYPDAESPRQLWENVLAGRRAFRRLPDERMRLSDYWSADPSAPDRFYADHAAVIEGYEFDRVGYRVAGSTYRSTDLTHWLALDVASQALADAGFPAADGLPRERTGVVVGNSLTGEFTRANQMRLRWPYVRRVVAAALQDEGWDADALAPFLTALEKRYKEPFPPVDEDTLAGALSNTIAGRICNYYDLKGGGYTVDGACSSSLLSVATACRALRNDELDVAVAGGVDLSIDPFEIIGFAKAGALATGEMRVYDRQSSGFWPGEGCGMVVLMREEDARAAGHHVYATIAGYGVSSDGKGGITRPEPDGYRFALAQAYRQAGFGVDTVGLFEGHGTGTAVGDATELGALSHARREAAPAAPPAAIGSVKAMIGHTKAAAGVAGFLKATLAVQHEVLPPTVGCLDPHPHLSEEDAALRVLPTAEPWPADTPVRAGITAMGFGGINTHLVVENPEPRRRSRMAPQTAAVARVAAGQGATLLVADADSPQELATRLSTLAVRVAGVSYAEVGDLAAVLQREAGDRPYRAAVVAASPAQAAQRLRQAADRLDSPVRGLRTVGSGALVGRADDGARVGFLFPGQGSGERTDGGAVRRRFAAADDCYTRAALPDGEDVVATAVAQPRIVTGSLAVQEVLAAFGVSASVAVGHSLGELSALHWAGSLDEPALLALARERGRVMTAHSAPGTMASVGADADEVTALIGDDPVVVAGYNAPRQTVVSGPAEAVAAVGARAAQAGLGWVSLPVSHAFHSPLVAPAAEEFAGTLRQTRFAPVRLPVVSTVTGEALPADADLAALLQRQITDPVRFADAVRAAAVEADLFVEVGPGSVLSGLAGAATDVPSFATDTDSPSLAPLLTAVGAAYVAGAPVRFDPLLADRPDRSLHVDGEPRFFVNPCERAPDDGDAAGALPEPAPTGAGELVGAHAADGFPESDESQGNTTGGDTMGRLRELVAQRAELPVEAVTGDSRLLDDLHLSSITVGQVLVQAAQETGLPATEVPTSFATATLREVADALDELQATTAGTQESAAADVAGVDSWVRPFAVVPVPVPDPVPAGEEASAPWRVYARSGDPLAGPLRRELERGGVGSGVAVCLPPDCPEPELAQAVDAARAALAQQSGERFLVVQHGRGASGVARTLRQEAPHVRTTVVDTPPDPQVVPRIVADVRATTGFREVCYGPDGTRTVPRLRAFEPAPGPHPLSGDDVLLVTGGGKGITAECALTLAADSGARLALLGRSDPAQDEELAANLTRMAEAGVVVRYLRADVGDPAAVRAAVEEIGAAWGPVTAVLHGAGRNQPQQLAQLDRTALRDTFAPKLDGLEAVLAAVDPAALRLLVTFGSIIGRAGLRGEAHYATANDWLAHATVAAAERLPRCRVLCLEWSVWSGVGMGERLSVVESLMREGITPITPDRGVAVLRQLVADPDTPQVVVVTGRADGVDTVDYDRPELPLLRFVDQPLRQYPGVELVVQTRLAADSDPYLADHRLDDNLLFPAVCGLEAMAQVACALRGGAPTAAEEVELLRPVVVPPDGETTVRIAALRQAPDRVVVTVRSSETAYAADHFRATLCFDDQPVPAAGAAGGAREPVAASVCPVSLDPASELYGPVLFQGPRFQRLRGYRWVAARHAEGRVATEPPAGWFDAFRPGEMVLADPGARDALMHGLQVCVPDATLLPAGVSRIVFAAEGSSWAPDDRRELTFVATERHHEGDTYLYDITVRGPDGAVVEHWDGLRLQAVRKTEGRGPWPVSLLGPFLERRLSGLLDAAVAVAVEPDCGAGRRTCTATAVRRALGYDAQVRYRPDGRPALADGSAVVSASHGAGLTTVVAAPSGHDAVGCDVEAVVTRPWREWEGLLGRYAAVATLLADETGEPVDTAATRAWCAVECLRKLGAATDTPLSPQSRPAPGWVVLRAGDATVATAATTVAGAQGAADPVVFAVAVPGGTAAVPGGEA